MAKYYGPVGYAIPTEVRPGVVKDQIEEHSYYGDVLRNSSQWQSSQDGTNDNLNIRTQISIVADPFANEHFHTMKYIRHMGANWKITEVEPRYPRLILTIGGVYNGPTKS